MTGLSGESGVASVGDCSSSSEPPEAERWTSEPPEAEHTLVSLSMLRCVVRAGGPGVAVAAALGVEPPPRKRPSAEAALVGGGSGPRRLVGGEKNLVRGRVRGRVRVRVRVRARARVRARVRAR